MSVALSTPAMIINDALKRIGRKIRVGSMWEGSEPAKMALDIYAQTRDDLLRDSDWGFSEATVVASASGATVPAQWSYSYAYPSDCVRVRALYAATYLANQNNPLPVNWRVSNAVVSGSNVQVVLTNMANASLVYSKRVTDPKAWDAGFTEALCAALGERLAPVLSSPDLAKLEAEEDKDQTAQAAAISG